MNDVLGEKSIKEKERETFVQQLVEKAQMFRMPQLPENPQKETWYRIEKPGYVCGNGQPYHGSMRIGTENKILVLFNGGGASWTEYTAKRPISVQNSGEEAFYFDDVEPLSDMLARGGINSQEAWNPFRNWSVVCIYYSSGDFHIGDAEFDFQTEGGEKKTLHQHGYRNYRMVMETAKKYLPDPEKLMIAGMSAGGFGAAALSDDVIQQFPGCRDITCCIDSSLFRYDWKPVAAEIWNAPQKIVSRLHSSNAVLDWLTALYEAYGKRVKYLYMNSVRDGELAKFQRFLDGESAVYTKEDGVTFQDTLKEMCTGLQQAIPDIGIYIYNFPYPGLDPQLELTQHTLLLENSVKDRDRNRREQQKSVLEWLWDAANDGKSECIGLDLLKK